MAPLKLDSVADNPPGKAPIHGLTAMAPLKLADMAAQLAKGGHPWPHGHGPIEALTFAVCG